MTTPRALLVLTFPTPPRELEPFDARDLARALHEAGDRITAGRHPHGGTIIVPRQERTSMKVSIDLAGPNGRMWSLDMEYKNLPPEYAAEIASVARSYAAYIENTAAGAGQGPSYAVSFKYDADPDELQGVAAPMAAVFKGHATRKGLLYSQAVAVQDAGIKLLEQLQAGAHREIASGQRK